MYCVCKCRGRHLGTVIVLVMRCRATSNSRAFSPLSRLARRGITYSRSLYNSPVDNSFVSPKQITLSCLTRSHNLNEPILTCASQDSFCTRGIAPLLSVALCTRDLGGTRGALQH